MAAAFASARLEAATERTAGRSSTALVSAQLAAAAARFLGRILGLGLQLFAGSLVAVGRLVVEATGLEEAIAAVEMVRTERSAQAVGVRGGEPGPAQLGNRKTPGSCFVVPAVAYRKKTSAQVQR